MKAVCTRDLWDRGRMGEACVWLKARTLHAGRHENRRRAAALLRGASFRELRVRLVCARSRAVVAAPGMLEFGTAPKKEAQHTSNRLRWVAVSLDRSQCLTPLELPESGVQSRSRTGARSETALAVGQCHLIPFRSSATGCANPVDRRICQNYAVRRCMTIAGTSITAAGFDDIQRPRRRRTAR